VRRSRPGNLLKSLRLHADRMYYTRLRVECPSEFSEILIAELGECGFDTFMENESGFEAYAEQDLYDSGSLTWLKEKYTGVIDFDYSLSRVEKENWNEQWEKSFEPVVVEEACVVRAEFHRLPRTYPYEIVITPKMSFGTGHHATTWLMLKIQLQLEMGFKYRQVMGEIIYPCFKARPEISPAAIKTL